MNCRAAERLIQHALDAPLSAPERVRLDAHLSGCPACQRLWDDYRRLSRDAGEWVRRPAHVETPAAEFTAQVMARLGSRPVAAPLWPRLLVCGMVLALLVAASLAAAPWLPPVPKEGLYWESLRADGLWTAAQGVLAVRWAALLLLPALAVNALFVLRARRAT